jgi:hypothetical protein
MKLQNTQTLWARTTSAVKECTFECAPTRAWPARLQVIGGAAPAALAAPTNGLALMGLIYAFGSTSGAHLSE